MPVRGRPALPLAALLFLAGCLKPTPKEDPQGPMFRFTSEFDSSGFAWEVHTDFETLTDDPACRKLTAVSSQPRPRTLSFTRILSSPAGKVVAPMTLKGGGPCQWTLASVWLQDMGAACFLLPNHGFSPPVPDSLGEPKPPLPDTLTWNCRPDAEKHCLECDRADGEPGSDFTLDPSRDAAVHIRIRKE